MANLTHSIAVSSQGDIKVIPNIVTPIGYWRKPHDVEIVNYNAPNGDDIRYWAYRGDGVNGGPVRQTVIDEGKGMPEVYRVYPSQVTSLSCAWVKLWRELNPKLSNERFCTLLDYKLAWCNGTGFGDPSDPRENCILNKNMGRKPPAFHASIINGGALLRPKKIENSLFWIEGLLTSQPVPSAEYVLARPWLWYYGTNVLPDGRVNYITRLGTDGAYHPVRVPVLSREPLYMPLSWLDELPIDFNPATYDARRTDF